MSRTKYFVQAAVIAAIYAVLTLAVPGLSYGQVQCRFSEALTVLPVFTTAAIPGLAAGCLLANFIGGFGIYDIVFGTLATLLGACGTYLLRRCRPLAPLPPVLCNAGIIGPMLYLVMPNESLLWVNVLSVGLGELAACYALGLPLMYLFQKHPRIIGANAPH